MSELPDFAVEVTSDDHSPVARVTGDIDLANVAEFEKSMFAAGDGSPVLTVDLTGVDYCDSAAIRALFALAATTRLTMIVSPAGQITRLVAISGLDRSATVVEE